MHQHIEHDNMGQIKLYIYVMQITLFLEVEFSKFGCNRYKCDGAKYNMTGDRNTVKREGKDERRKDKS